MPEHVLGKPKVPGSIPGMLVKGSLVESVVRDSNVVRAVFDVSRKYLLGWIDSVVLHKASFCDPVLIVLQRGLGF